MNAKSVTGATSIEVVVQRAERLASAGLAAELGSIARKKRGLVLASTGADGGVRPPPGGRLPQGRTR